MFRVLGATIGFIRRSSGFGMPAPIHRWLEAARRRREESRSRKARLDDLLTSAHSKLVQLPALLTEADAQLNRAEAEYAAGAFAAFWDAIERATKQLAAYRSGIVAIDGDVNRYREEAAQASVDSSRFSLFPKAVPDGRSTALRLARLIRKAQCDFADELEKLAREAEVDESRKEEEGILDKIQRGRKRWPPRFGDGSSRID